MFRLLSNFSSLDFFTVNKCYTNVTINSMKCAFVFLYQCNFFVGTCACSFEFVCEKMVFQSDIDSNVIQCL